MEKVHLCPFVACSKPVWPWIWNSSKVEGWETSTFYDRTFAAAICPTSCGSHCCFIAVCLWPRDPPAFICTSVRTTPSLYCGQNLHGPDTHKHAHTHTTDIMSVQAPRTWNWVDSTRNLNHKANWLSCVSSLKL